MRAWLLDSSEYLQPLILDNQGKKFKEGVAPSLLAIVGCSLITVHASNRF